MENLLMEEEIVHLIKHILLEYDVEQPMYLKLQLMIELLKKK